MDKRKKWVISLISIILFILLAHKVFMFMVDRNERYLPVPDYKDLEKIILINVEDKIGLEKVTINGQEDIKKFLEIFVDSVRTDRESIGDFPDKRHFTVVVFNFGVDRNSWRSFYREGQDIYIDQPYYRVFEVEAKDVDELDKTIEIGVKENILVNLEDILNNNFLNGI